MCEGELYIIILYTDLFLAKRKTPIVNVSHFKKTEKDFLKDKNITTVIKGKKERVVEYKDEIIMLNGYCLLESVDTEEIKDTLKLLPCHIRRKKSTLYGKVAYKGSLLRNIYRQENNGDNFDVNVGDIVAYEKFCDIDTEYDLHRELDKQYFRVQRRNMIGIINKSLIKIDI
jgi:co-chaperonin GroES (HSP10)